MPNKLQIKFIKDAMDEPEKLTDWESEFINNIAGLANDRELSEKQNSILNRIVTKLNKG